MSALTIQSRTSGQWADRYTVTITCDRQCGRTTTHTVNANNPDDATELARETASNTGWTYNTVDLCRTCSGRTT